MGELAERVKINLLVNGNGIPDNFKNNSLYFYNKYQSSTPEVLSVSVTDIQPGGFYFLHYLDTSNWMQFSVFSSALLVKEPTVYGNNSFANAGAQLDMKIVLFSVMVVLLIISIKKSIDNGTDPNDI